MVTLVDKALVDTVADSLSEADPRHLRRKCYMALAKALVDMVCDTLTKANAKTLNGTLVVV